MMVKLSAAVAASLFAATPVTAQPFAEESSTLLAAAQDPSVSAGPASAPQPSCCTIPKGHYVELEIAAPLTSRTNRHGDWFPIRLAEAITIDGVEIVPAGTEGMGQVVHGARSRMAGGAGELTLAVRYLEHCGQRIPLHRLRYFVPGRSNEQLAFAVAVTPIIGPLSIFITGGEVRVPEGTRVRAEIAADVSLQPPTQP